MSAIDLAVFDMAGTTVQDDGQVPAAFTSALAAHGIAVSAQAVRAIRGASKRQAIFDLLPPGGDRAAHAQTVYATFREHLARRYDAGVRAIPGAADAFAALRTRGVKVALNTGFDRDTTEMLLAALGWTRGAPDGVVDAVVCGDEVLQGRPAPYLIFRCMEAVGALRVDRVAVIGDTTLDLQAGNNASVRFVIGVLSGAHGREELLTQPHTHLLASVAEVPGVLLQKR